MFTATGIFFGFLCNLLVVLYIDHSSRWRFLTITTLIPTIPLLFMIYLMPESPRYLMKHGRYEKALEAFTQVRTTPLLAVRDLMYAHAQLDFDSRMLQEMTSNECANLADRVDVDASCRSDGAPGASEKIRDDSSLPVSGGQRSSLNQEMPSRRVDGRNEPSEASIQNLQPPTNDVQEDRIELAGSLRQMSDASSFDVDRCIENAKTKANPYSYHIGVTGYFKRLAQLWTNMRCRRALLAASVAMLSQQMTGVNTIAFLGTIVLENSLIWEHSNSEKKSAEVAAIIGLAFGAANYLGGLPAYWLSDKIGRSIMLSIGLPNMAWSMLVFAFLFKIPKSSVQVPLISIFAVIFVLIYAPTAGTSPFSISAEVFPLVSREAGMAVSVAVNLLGAGVLVLIFPFLLDSIGNTGALSIFAGLNVIAFFLVYLFVPETKGRTLEELRYTFDLPTRLHVRYRASYVQAHFRRNWWRYLTRTKIADEDVPIAFYEWARIKYGKSKDSS